MFVPLLMLIFVPVVECFPYFLEFGAAKFLKLGIWLKMLCTTSSTIAYVECHKTIKIAYAAAEHC